MRFDTNKVVTLKTYCLLKHNKLFSTKCCCCRGRYHKYIPLHQELGTHALKLSVKSGIDSQFETRNKVKHARMLLGSCIR